jgi:hypothetical protein
LHGVGTEVRSAIAFAKLHRSSHASGLEIDRAQLPFLLARAGPEYEKACARLHHDAEARGCFVWENESRVRLAPNGQPEFDRAKLVVWLRMKSKLLCDAFKQTAPIPKNARGEPTTDPEHWGIWPACDRSLWAWRQMVRMAEVARVAEAGQFARPQYETLPWLRSQEPNLAVYRRLGAPIFRPRNEHIFLSGRVIDAKIRSLAAIISKHEYVDWRRRGGFQLEFKNHPDMRRAIARALYARNAVADALDLTPNLSHGNSETSRRTPRGDSQS